MTSFEKALTSKPEFSGVSGSIAGETGANAANSLGDVGAARKPRIFVQFSDCGRHIRKWSMEPFDGGQEYKMVTRSWACVVDGIYDPDPTCVIDDHRFSDCLFAKPGMCREDCEHWQNIPTPEARHD